MSERTRRPRPTRPPREGPASPRAMLYACADPGLRFLGTKGSSIHARELLRAVARCGTATHAVVVSKPSRREAPADASFLESLEEVSLESWLRHAIGRKNGTAAAATRNELGRMLLEPPFERAVRGAIEAYHPAFVHERLSLFSLAALRAARETATPLVLEVNAPLTDEARQWRDLGLPDHAAAVEGVLLRHADRVACVSSWLVDWALALGAEEDRVFLLPNAADPERFAPRPRASGAPRHPDAPPRLPGWEDAFVIGFTGSLKPWHGLPIALEAMREAVREMPRLRLAIAGQGPEMDRLVARTREIGIEDHVAFLGAVDHAAIPDLLSSWDAFVAPYPRLEAFYFSPLKLYEAMAAGLPVVASAQGDLPDLLEDGRAGRLVEPGDAKALAACFVALARRPEEARALGKAAREAVLGRHTWDHRARRLLEVMAAVEVAG